MAGDTALLGATQFLTLREITTFVWVATHNLGTSGLIAQTCFHL